MKTLLRTEWFKFVTRLKAQRVGARVEFGGFTVGENVKASLMRDSSLILCDGVHLGEFTRLGLGEGACLHVCKDTKLTGWNTLYANKSIQIGSGCALAPHAMIVDYNHTNLATGECAGEAVTIAKGTWIGAYSIVLSGVFIGENAVVGANSTVTHDVKANTKVAGNPAKEIQPA
jgi:maltose O-acetyltransferase